MPTIQAINITRTMDPVIEIAFYITTLLSCSLPEQPALVNHIATDGLSVRSINALLG
jgi:hypothetical protein